MNDEFDSEQQGQKISAAEWRDLRIALGERLRSLTAELKETRGEDEKKQLRHRIDEIKQQVQTLAVEETVAQFLEDAERYITATSAITEELQRDPDAEVA